MFNLALLPLAQATWETIYMVFIASFMGLLLGLVYGTFLFTLSAEQPLENRAGYRFLSFIVNVTRSVPFIILMISIIPLTHLLVGTSIGINAAIVPLTIAAIAFYAKVSEAALLEVPKGLSETANALGASIWQWIMKILIPESLPALIRGATLTVIGLVGYSAMAGAVGGGGLGELAINYGYQRFNAWVMLETVIVLVILVQILQSVGDYFAKTRRIKPIIFASILLWLLCFIYAFIPMIFHESNTLRVGVLNGWPEDVMAVAQKVAEKNYGLHLKIVTFTDYVEPNVALENGSIDANIFQHAPYLAAQMAANHWHLAILGKTFVYPMGFFSTKIQSLSQLPQGALVAIPNDPSNGARALLLLQRYGLIQLKPNSGALATVHDIVKNPDGLKFILLDAAALPRVLKDATLVAVTNDYMGPAGLSLQHALMREGSDSLYANIIVVRQGDVDRPVYQALLAVMHSKPVVAKTLKIFPDGAAIPAWK